MLLVLCSSVLPGGSLPWSLLRRPGTAGPLGLWRLLWPPAAAAPGAQMLAVHAAGSVVSINGGTSKSFIGWISKHINIY